MTGVTTAHDDAQLFVAVSGTSAQSYQVARINPEVQLVAGTSESDINGECVAFMIEGDVATLELYVAGGTRVVGVYFGNPSTDYRTYDANGNMTSWTGETETWKSHNYPAEITGPSESFTFLYAPDRTVWREIQTGGEGDTTYNLAPPLMSVVVNSSGTTDRNYIYAGNEPVAIDERTSSSNTFYYLLTDHQGSLYGITNSSGAMVVGESFHASGQRRNPDTWTDPISGSDVNTIGAITPRGYTFKETLESTRINNLGGRAEDSFIGRFLSADPTVPDPTDPQIYNGYSYARNNPLTYVDPSGFDDCSPYDFPSPGGDPGDNSGGDPGDGGNGQTLDAYQRRPSANDQCFDSPLIDPLNPESPFNPTNLPPVVIPSTELPPETGTVPQSTPSTGPSPGGSPGGGGGATKPNPPQQTTPQQSTPQKPNQQQCTAAQQQAAQLAGALDNYSHLSGLFALGTGLAAAISGAGEGVTFGVDTPVTISFGSATAFFATESAITGGAAAALNSFGSGNTTALASFDVSSLTDTAVSGIAEKIPGVGSYAEVAGQLAGEVADVVNAARGACE